MLTSELQVGGYRIGDRIGEGGMGTVYRATHNLLGRSAAIKVLRPELTSNPQIVNRFFNEARAITAIKHPGIVEVYDFGYLESGLAYLVMELLDGETLTERTSAGPLGEDVAAGLLRGVCVALAAAHAKGIIHRDLKPDNIFLVRDADGGERAKILDFGIAKLTRAGTAQTATMSGIVMGTPAYMAPEQCRGSGDVDHRADLYALGCIFYQLVTGHTPFGDDGTGEVLGRHLYVAPEPPSTHVALSDDCEALIMALLEKDPARRPQTARDLTGHLAAIANRTATLLPPTAPTLRRPTPLPRAPSPRQLVTRPMRAEPVSAPMPSEPPPRRSDAGMFVIAPPPRPRSRVLTFAIVAAMTLVLAALVFTLLHTKTAPPAATTVRASTSSSVSPPARTAPATGTLADAGVGGADARPPITHHAHPRQRTNELPVETTVE